MIRQSFRLKTVVFAAFALVLLCQVSNAGPRNFKRYQEPDFYLEGHTEDPLAVAFFPDGKHIVSGGMDRTVCIWDLPTRKLVNKLAGHEGSVLTVAVSADGKFVASGSSDHSIRIWDAKSGDQVAQLDGHTGDVCAVDFLPDGTLLSGAKDGLRIWKVADEKTIWQSKDETMISHLAVSKDGKRCAYASAWDATSGVYDLVTHRRLCVIQSLNNKQPAMVGLSWDGKRLFADIGGNDLKIACLDVDTNAEIEPHFTNLDAFATSDDGSIYVTATWATATMYDPAKKKPGLQLVLNGGHVGQPEALRAAAISPDGQTVACAVGGGRVGTDWTPGLRHYIAIFSPTDVNSPPLGPVAGKVSWEVIPVKAKEASGKTIPFSECFGMFDDYGARAAGVAPGLDVVMYGNAIYFHRQKGLLEQILEPKSQSDDFAWDGERLWVATIGYGMRLVNRDGTPGLVIGAKEGLPDGLQNMRLMPLGPGKMLVAGNAIAIPPQRGVNGMIVSPVGPGALGWIAVVETLPTGAQTKVVFRGEQLAADLPEGFKPIWMTRRPAGSADHSIWLGCAPSGKSNAPILRVDPATFAVTPFNLTSAQVPPAHGPTDLTADTRAINFRTSANKPPAWFDTNTILRLQNNLSALTIGDSIVDVASEKVLFHRQLIDEAPFLQNDDQILIPGRRWLAVNPKKLEVENLGPGLRVEGVLVENFILYFNSAVLGGPAAISHMDGAMYRFSVDPSHPLPIHATDEAPPVYNH